MAVQIECNKWLLVSYAQGDIVIPNGTDVQASINVEILKPHRGPFTLLAPVPVLLSTNDCAAILVNSLCHTRLPFRQFLLCSGIKGSTRLSNVRAVTVKIWNVVDQSSRLDWVSTKSEIS